jgi:hypothetical protein
MSQLIDDQAGCKTAEEKTDKTPEQGETPLGLRPVPSPFQA